MKRSTPGARAGPRRRASAKGGAGRTVRAARRPASPPRAFEERYKAFIENIDDGVYEVDLHGNFTYFNNALCEVFGHSRKKIQGQNFSRFMDEERPEQLLKSSTRSTGPAEGSLISSGK